MDEREQMTWNKACGRTRERHVKLARLRLMQPIRAVLEAWRTGPWRPRRNPGSQPQDLARMPQDDPKYDRLLLNPERLADIAHDLRSVAALPSPVGEVLQTRRLDNGLELSKVRVPMGVIAVIFESRPNVTFDVFALCLKTRMPAF